MHKKLSTTVRASVGVAAIAMLLVLYLPIWKIELTAPQYPEGLTLRIYADRIGGDVDVVNGLNHYIGMHTLHTRDFVEFIALPWIIGGFAGLGLIVAALNRRSFFYGWAALFCLIAFTSMIDFYRWEYNYGHNLDPDAPIKVPGMAYQPPMLGYKQLLNFGAYSIPDAGGLVFAGVGVLLAVTVVVTERRARRGVSAAALVLVSVMTLPGCGVGPQPIRYGQDNCDFCRMTFTDRRFGGEVCTRTGKVYKFDDLHCLLGSLKAGVPDRKAVSAIYLVNYTGGAWISADAGLLLRSPALHTPMGGDIAVFADSSERSRYQHEYNGEAITWKDLYR